MRLKKDSNPGATKLKADRFYLINFHPAGESEAFICSVAKGSNQSSLFELRPDRVKNYDITLRSAFGGPMKASDSCNIQVLNAENMFCYKMAVFVENPYRRAPIRSLNF